MHARTLQIDKHNRKEGENGANIQTTKQNPLNACLKFCEYHVISFPVSINIIVISSVHVHQGCSNFYIVQQLTMPWTMLCDIFKASAQGMLSRCKNVSKEIAGCARCWKKLNFNCFLGLSV